MKKKIKLAVVEWYDAYHGENCQRDPYDRGVLSYSVGHLVERNKHGIRLSVLGHFDTEDTNAKDMFFRDQHFIPSGMIKKVTIRRI